MNEQMFWVWNGWGVACLALIAVWQFLHGYVSVVARHLSYLRNPLALFLALPAIVGGFVLSGWIAGLLNVVLGPMGGVVLMKLFLPIRR
jgi:hypothetical protein